MSRDETSGSLAIMITALLAAFLFFNHFTLLDSYKKVKKQLEMADSVIDQMDQQKDVLNATEKNLQKQIDQLAIENNKLKDHDQKVSRGTEEISSQLEAAKNKIDELIVKNKELQSNNKDLTNDNVALQNSLKMAAAAGVKPQSFTPFSGLEPRETLNRGKFVGKFLGTAYTPSKEECGNNKGITKSGKPIIPGVTIAVDRKYWPLGTVFYIKGLGYTVAMDSGSAIKGKYRFDFSVFDKEFARQLGTRKWEVYLVRYGTGNILEIKL